MSDSSAQEPEARGLGFDEEAGCYERSFESADDVVTQLVLTVATIAEVEPEDLPPLHRTLDTDIIERLLAHDSEETNARLSFTYYDFRVTLWADGDATIQPLSD